MPDEAARRSVALEVRTTTPGSATVPLHVRGAQYEAEPMPVERQGRRSRLDNGKIQFLTRLSRAQRRQKS